MEYQSNSSGVKLSVTDLLAKKMYDEAYMQVLKSPDELQFIKVISKLSSKPFYALLTYFRFRNGLAFSPNLVSGHCKSPFDT